MALEQALEQGSDMGTDGSRRGVSHSVRLTTVLAVCVLVATTMGGCSSPKPKAVVHASTAPTPTPTVAATNPLTGLGGSPIGSVIAVKVDDTAAGRPSLGLEQADVIYIEEAEGGLSRMVAVHIYVNAKPNVRAVRSVRTSDPELLGAHGKIILVASGGGAALCQSWTAQVYSARSTTAGKVGFFRDPSRLAPYNLV
jgi:hypothetical protein